MTVVLVLYIFLYILFVLTQSFIEIRDRNLIKATFYKRHFLNTVTPCRGYKWECSILVSTPIFTSVQSHFENKNTFQNFGSRSLFPGSGVWSWVLVNEYAVKILIIFF